MENLMSKLSHIAFAATILLAPGITCSQSYPAKPLRLIVAFARFASRHAEIAEESRAL
jgi:hypothetical protein